MSGGQDTSNQKSVTLLRRLGFKSLQEPPQLDAEMDGGE